jgi:hypothetical protein
MLLRLLDAHGHKNQLSKAFDIHGSCMQPCDQAEMQRDQINSFTVSSPIPIQHQHGHMAKRRDHACISLQSLATSRDKLINSQEIGRRHSNTQHALQ